MTDNNTIIKRGVIVVSSLTIILCVYSIIGERAEEKRQFRGVISKIVYSEKKTPTVTINNKTYAVGFTNRRFNDEMQQGDSLIKLENSRIYKLVKYKTGSVIFSNEK